MSNSRAITDLTDDHLETLLKACGFKNAQTTTPSLAEAKSDTTVFYEKVQLLIQETVAGNNVSYPLTIRMIINTAMEQQFAADMGASAHWAMVEFTVQQKTNSPDKHEITNIHWVDSIAEDQEKSKLYSSRLKEGLRDLIPANTAVKEDFFKYTEPFSQPRDDANSCGYYALMNLVNRMPIPDGHPLPALLMREIKDIATGNYQSENERRDKLITICDERLYLLPTFRTYNYKDETILTKLAASRATIFSDIRDNKQEKTEANKKTAVVHYKPIFRSEDEVKKTLQTDATADTPPKANGWRGKSKHRCVTSTVTCYGNGFGETLTTPFDMVITTGCAPNLMGTSPSDEHEYISIDKTLNLSAYKETMKASFLLWLKAQDEAGVDAVIIPFIGGGVYLDKLLPNQKLLAKNAIMEALKETLEENSFTTIKDVIFSLPNAGNNVESEDSKNAKAIFRAYNRETSISKIALTVEPVDVFDAAKKLKDAKRKPGLINPGSDRTIGGNYLQMTGGQFAGKITLEELICNLTDLAFVQSVDLNPAIEFKPLLSATTPVAAPVTTPAAAAATPAPTPTPTPTPTTPTTTPTTQAATPATATSTSTSTSTPITTPTTQAATPATSTSTPDPIEGTSQEVASDRLSYPTIVGRSEEILNGRQPFTDITSARNKALEEVLRSATTPLQDNIAILDSGTNITTAANQNITVIKMTIDNNGIPLTAATVREIVRDTATQNPTKVRTETFFPPNLNRIDTDSNIMELVAQSVKNHQAGLSPDMLNEPIKLSGGCSPAVIKAYILYCEFKGIALTPPNKKEYLDFKQEIDVRKWGFFGRSTSYLYDFTQAWNRSHPEDIGIRQQGNQPGLNTPPVARGPRN